MRGKWILFAGITILLAVAAGALSVYRGQGSRVKVSEPAKAPVAAAPPRVAEISLMGQIQAQRVVNVPAPIDGTVESYSAEIGQDVFEGQMIAHIRNTRLESEAEGATLELERIQGRIHEIEAAIVAGRLEASRAGADASRAKTEYDRTQKAFDRQQMLIKEGATPRLAFEKAEREYNSAKEDLDTKDKLAAAADDRVATLNRELDAAQRAVEERQQAEERAKASAGAGDVRAPVDGIVLSRHGQAGEEVNRTMQDLFRIAVALSALEIALQPEPAAVARIKVGQSASVHVAEVPDQITGTVREIKDGRIIVDFTSPSPAIRPGMTAQVRIELK